jgi:3-oxoacyl-[acyl-carrier-protein] synthase II
MRNRVVITGMGVVTSLGDNLEVFWENLLNGKSGISVIEEQLNTEGYPTKIAGEIKKFDPSIYENLPNLELYDRYIQFAAVGAMKALEHAELHIGNNIDPNRIGVIVGSGIGGTNTWKDNITTYRNAGIKAINSSIIYNLGINMAPAVISGYIGARGPNNAQVTACAAGNHSIGSALRIIQRGEADVMVTGGSEASISPGGFGGFSSIRAMSTRNEEPEKASRPFDIDRDGFVMSEGAGILILESLEHAKNRGAKIFAEVIGFGMSGDAFHITEPLPDGTGAKMSMINAIKDAKISPTDVDYINTHGTSTKLGDKAETQAIKGAFGSHAYNIAVNSTKSMTGHLVGAAGGVEAIISTLVLLNDKIPPTINIENQDPDCDLDYVPNSYRESPVKVALSNSFGFGGHNSSLILKKYEE